MALSAGNYRTARLLAFRSLQQGQLRFPKLVTVFLALIGPLGKILLGIRARIIA
jgi:hypothetical protein